MRFLLILVAMFALIVPLPALADAHPGAHLNPHLNEQVILGAVIGLVLLAVVIMWVHVALIRRHNRRVQRLIDTRLGVDTRESKRV